MIALLLLAACSGNPPPPVSTALAPQSPELAQVDAVVQAWRERTDLPRLDADRLRTLRVIDPETRAEYDELCDAGSGCTHGRNRCSWPGCERDIYVVIAPTRGDGTPITRGTRLSLIRHEAVHFAADIAGIGSDAPHRDRRLWPYPFVPQPRPPQWTPSPDVRAAMDATVEERARAIARRSEP